MGAVAERSEAEARVALPRKVSLECSACGYAIARAEPPERCPMCQAVASWTHTPWRPFSDRRLP